MYSLGDSPPLGEQLPFCVRVAAVTSAGLVALTLILAACSFFRKLRSEEGDQGSRSEMYVEEFYSNPAFMELPFDGSCSKPSNITHGTSMTEINNSHVKNFPTSSHSLPNGSTMHPQIAVAKLPVPSPYQEEPQYYVQENDQAGRREGEVNSAIETKNSHIEDILSGEAANGDEKLFVTGTVETESVIVNQGALKSFRNDEKGCYEVKGKENLEDSRKSVDEFEGDNDLNIVISPKKGHETLNSREMSKREELKQGQCDIIRKDKELENVEIEGDLKYEIERDEVKRGDIERTGSLSKRVRTSIDDSYMIRQNGVTTRQQVKKPKMSPSQELPAEYSSRRTSIGKKGSSVYRKRSKNSFSKVKRPFFHNRRKVTQTEDNLAAEVIQNPFTV